MGLFDKKSTSSPVNQGSQLGASDSSRVFGVNFSERGAGDANLNVISTDHGAIDAALGFASDNLGFLDRAVGDVLAESSAARASTLDAYRDANDSALGFTGGIIDTFLAAFRTEAERTDRAVSGALDTVIDFQGQALASDSQRIDKLLQQGGAAALIAFAAWLIFK